jgi:GT2 family glycosyltransferase
MPDLSVIISIYNAVDIISDCLHSLMCQQTDKAFEIIVVDSSEDGTAELVRQRFPSVRLYHFHERKHCGDARNFGLSIARSEVIAFLDADCTVDPGWVENVLAAHRSNRLVIGGVIDNGPRRNMVGWAYYFCEYNLWLPSKTFRRPREIQEIAGCCLSMKRSAYDSYGPFIEGTYCSDTAFHWKLLANGHRVLQDPKIRVYHTAYHNYREFLSHIFSHRRQFAKVSRRFRGEGSLVPVTKVLLTPLLPVLLFALITLRVFQARVYRVSFIRSSPLVLAGLFARTLGELIGLLEESRHQI